MPLDDLPDFLADDDLPSKLGEEPSAENPILAGLTDAQKSAVLHTEGPLLILAAAGSGKTRVITRRIAHIIEQGTHPQHVQLKRKKLAEHIKIDSGESSKSLQFCRS